MKALIMRTYGELLYEDLPAPEINDGEVLVRVKACAICGSDVHGLDGSTKRRIPPVVMGHEAAGVIEKTGSGVKGFKTGDRVTFDSTVYCGNCYYCRRSEVNLCDDRKVMGVSCDEYRLYGAFAEYVAVPSHILYHLPDNVSYEEAAVVEPLSVALHAFRRINPSMTQTVAVVGAGMIGLLVIQLLRAAGCSKIIAIDQVDDRLEMAAKFGATHTFSANRVDIHKEIMALTNNRGVDAAFEAVGINETLQTAVSVLRKGGALALIGNLSPTVTLPLQIVVTRQISIFGSCASAGEYEDCLELISSGKVDVNPLISVKAPLSEGAEWFKKLSQPGSGLLKVVLNP